MKKKIFAICLSLVMGLNFMSACGEETDDNERRRDDDDSSVSDIVSADSDEREKDDKDEDAESKKDSDSSDEKPELSDEEKDDEKKDDEDDDKESSSEHDEDIALEDDFEMSEYYERCQKGELFGYYSSASNEQGIYDVVNDKYYSYDYDVDITESYNGYLPFCVNEKYGYIDIDGVVVIEPQFDYAKGFTSRGMALVEQNGCYGFINDKGEYIVEPVYDDYGTYNDEVYLEGYNEERLYVLNDGELVSEEEFRLLTADENELFYDYETEVVTDKYGNVIFDEVPRQEGCDFCIVGDGYYIIGYYEQNSEEPYYVEPDYKYAIVKDKTVICELQRCSPRMYDWELGIVINSDNKVLVRDYSGENDVYGELDLATGEITYYPEIAGNPEAYKSYIEMSWIYGFEYEYISLSTDAGLAMVSWEEYVYDEENDEEDYYINYGYGIVDTNKNTWTAASDYALYENFNKSGYAVAVIENRDGSGHVIIDENLEVVSTMDAEYWRLDD